MPIRSEPPFFGLNMGLGNATCTAIWEFCSGKSIKTMTENKQRQKNRWGRF